MARWENAHKRARFLVTKGVDDVSDLQQASARTEPTVVAGRYRIHAPLGRGGRSVVFAAHDPLLDREVAVKVFNLSAASGAELKIQEAEARLAANLNHHALTTLFDAGIDTGDPSRPQIYLVMEHIPGADLREHLKAHGRLSPAQVAYLGFDLSEALQYLHEHGFLHRDIKPANVLIAERRIDTRIRGKLTDFGISSIIGLPDDGEYTTGTAAYLSPEQVDGRDATTASDVYALGLVLLEALTGTVAYPGGVEESAFARLDRDPQIPASVPAPLATILSRMTRLVPEERPDLGEVALAFQQAFVQDLVDAGRVAPTVLHSNEAERLAALRRYDILDTAPDAIFDKITRLASRMLDAPIALVTLVDSDRAWFKSRHGWDETQVDRDVSFCATTSPQNLAAWTIPDTRLDPRTRDNPLVTGDPHVRAYAGAPLVTRDGHELGALCVFDHEPRIFTPDQLADLSDLADVVLHEIELRAASRRMLFADR